MADYPIPESVLESSHRHNDDLLTAGLGVNGLRNSHKPTFADPANPTPNEIRRRAIHASWHAIADLDPAGGLGQVYGHIPLVNGREFHAFAQVPGLQNTHRVMLQAPDHFDALARCLVISASPGSRGIYGGIALAGAWGLPRGYAVAYTDKGAGSGYFDAESGSGVRLNGTRSSSEEEMLEFIPRDFTRESGIGIKFVHSGDNPEAHWGEYVLQTVVFALAMLNRAYPSAAPFTPENTRIIAVGLSNGGAAVLQAAGMDDHGWLDGVVAVSPNIHTPAGRSFFDYTSEIAIFMNSALATLPLREFAKARYGEGLINQADWSEALLASGLLQADDPQKRSEESLERLLARNWSIRALQTAVLTSDVEIWRSAGAAYAGSYLRRPIGHTPCISRYEALVPDAGGHLKPASTAVRASWWSDASGLPPGLGVVPANRAHPLVDSLLCIRGLWTDEESVAQALRAAVTETEPSLPRQDLPLWIVHGEDDGLIPMVFSSLPYVEWLRTSGCRPVFWRVPHVQHFDSLLSWPALAARYLPMLPYAYAALDALWAELEDELSVVDQEDRTFILPSRPRAGAALTLEHLGLQGFIGR